MLQDIQNQCTRIDIYTIFTVSIKTNAMTTTATQTETNSVREHFSNGGTFANMNFQFVKRADGAMLRFDLNKGTYKFYNDEDKFYRAVVRFTKRGW